MIRINPIAGRRDLSVLAERHYAGVRGRIIQRAEFIRLCVQRCRAPGAVGVAELRRHKLHHQTKRSLLTKLARKAGLTTGPSLTPS